jgi:hypothetical protein
MSSVTVSAAKQIDVGKKRSAHMFSQRTFCAKGTREGYVDDRREARRTRQVLAP